ncbi:glycosyltransferase [Bacillus sp. OK048]|uniref:glycosyltransferase n=1 Tax=Bacillus sp. OK048 TaxID=1882761 RepID=UPI000887EFE6|nr:glycosyltransferase [Bacillus sp. OK048]SDM78295.1 Glycosyltransferase involved in cell wall bisynthesis [Bacillus sp. OK048]
MKKILFMLINMNVGGTEKALLNMISEIPKEDYEITILMLEKYGGFLNSIPEHVHIKFYNGYKDIKHILNKPPRTTVLNFLKAGKVLQALNITLIHLLSSILKERTLLFKYLLKGYYEIDTEYDLAVAYAGPMDFISFFVINKIKAKKKVQWIHFDINKIGFNKRFALKVYKKFDKIFIVSKEAKSKLISLVPQLSGKSEVFFNIVSPEIIRNQAKDGNGFKDEFDGLRILTIGRLSREKGQDLAIRALAKLKKDGCKVRWYCIGEGDSRKNYQKLIMDYNLEDSFILLGADTNPYPYLEQCDLYVQPSRYEGYCITIIEAKQFNKPIVTTNVNGAKEQIVNGKTGLIVNIDENEIYSALKNLIDSSYLRAEISSNLAKENYDTSLEMIKIFNVMEG